ncbi:MAG TPA: SCO family protein [Sedimenticola thiotaurini]|uniref:SCO family protein n=1 Tax=Sedimenticola thiotaurini TaxID=1543721 RepID=A0A831RN80_9GAMM|nr:SCO family protein [Sedimenticola thiotaurini]
MKRLLPWILVVSLALALAWVMVSWHPGENDGGHLSGPPKGGDFVLQSADGPVSLEQLRGKVVVLYFGYTWCPDICPTSLGLLSAALNELSTQELARFQALFISVDPERDSVERLREYAAYFHPAILGVTGTPEQLQRVARQYGAAYRIVRQDSAAGYLVDHSADLYVIDKQGRLRETLHHGTPPERILEVLKRYLAE